jgi:hypothetical protein
VPPRSLIVASACSGRTQPSSRCSSKLCRPDHLRMAQRRARRQGTSVSSDESDFNRGSRGVQQRGRPKRRWWQWATAAPTSNHR